MKHLKAYLVVLAIATLASSACVTQTVIDDGDVNTGPTGPSGVVSPSPGAPG